MTFQLPRDIEEDGLDDFLKTNLRIDDALTVVISTTDEKIVHVFAKGPITQADIPDKYAIGSMFAETASRLEGVRLSDEYCLCLKCFPWNGCFWVPCPCPK